MLDGVFYGPHQGKSMQIKINEVLRSYIEPLTESEYTSLERSILAEGCRDALVLWQDVLVDGHNRPQAPSLRVLET